MIQTISGRQFPKVVIPLIDSAKHSINAVVFDWRWYDQDPSNPVQLFNQAIVRAVRRGVQVRAIANNDRIVRILSACGIQARKITTLKLVHCKLMVIDNEAVITGSHNYTQSAFQANLELSVCLIKPENISDFLNYFDNLWAKF